MKLKKTVLLYFTACLITIVSGADLASDRASLLTLRATVGGRTLLWNSTETNPCLWTGVTCNDKRVTALRLPAMGLSGNLPSGLGNLTELQTLSLRYNALTGPIPLDFAKLVSLRNLYLHSNFFSGEVPEFLYGLQNLVRLNLGKNNFSGEISKHFNNLTRLDTLFLEQNMFTGSVPDLNVPPLHQFNVSFNNLTGEIPKRFSRLNLSAFSGNSLCGNPLQVACPGNNDKNGLSGGAIAGIVIGCVFGLVLILVLLVLCCRKRKKSDSDNVARAKSVEGEVSREKTRDFESGGGVGGGGSYSGLASTTASTSVSASGVSLEKSLIFIGDVSRKFSLDDLLKASAEVLGKGTFGTTYKATLEMGISVAVKRLKDVTASERDFREKIEEVGKLVHEKLVPLRGYYFSKDEKLVVYDYMPMGSLSALLHGMCLSFAFDFLSFCWKLFVFTCLLFVLCCDANMVGTLSFVL